MTNNCVLVTGASGFVGRRIAQQLRERNYNVRALVRRAPDKPLADSVELVFGDLTKPDSYVGALKGVSAVVHAALTGDLTQDLKASETLYRQCAAQGVAKFIHLSSIAIYGNPSEGIITEDTPPCPALSEYSRTKLAIEGAIRAASGSIETVILRLGCVYGPGGGWWTEGMLHLMRSGRVMAVDGGVGTANLIYVDDVAAIVLLLLARPNATLEIFNVTDGMPIPWSQYLSELEKIVGRSATVAMTATEALAYGNRWLHPTFAMRVVRKLRGKRFIHPLDESGVAGFASSAEFSNARAKNMLGFKPVYDLERGMRDAVGPT